MNNTAHKTRTTRVKGSIHPLAPRPLGSKDFVESLVTELGIDIRVDWNGDPEGLGRFEVRVESDTWQTCPNIALGAINDFVVPKTSVTGEQISFRVQRGPEHAAHPFEIKLVPISWLEGRKPDVPSAPSYTAERGVDYEYQGGASADDFPWHASTSVENVHRVTIELAKGPVYEMRIRLQDPGDPYHWLEQDPLVGTDRGGGN